MASHSNHATQSGGGGMPRGGSYAMRSLGVHCVVERCLGSWRHWEECSSLPEKGGGQWHRNRS
jgi:hypothetical protein